MPKSSSASCGAGAAQPLEDLGRLLGILHHQALGDLQAQRALGHDVAAEDVADLLDEVLTEDLPARDVDGYEQRPLLARQLTLPARCLVRGAQEDVRAEAHDEIRLLGDGDEVVRAHQAALGMLPAHQRLEAGQLLGRQVDDRLIEDLDLVLRQRLAQVALQRDAVVAVGAHLRTEDLDAVGAAALGAVHGDLGLFVEVEVTGRLAIVDGDADRSGQHDFLPGDLDRGAQRTPYALGERRRDPAGSAR